MARNLLPRGSLAARAVLVANDPFSPVKTLEDRRAVEVLLDEQADAALREKARVALDEARCSYDEAVLDAIVSDLRGIARDAEAIKTRMIETGRKLLNLQRVAGEGGYRSLFRQGLIPIAESLASK